MNNKELTLQRALGTLPARHYLIVTIGVELDDATPTHITDKVNLSTEDTADDVYIEDFDFPITSKENFFDQIIQMYTRSGQ